MTALSSPSHVVMTDSKLFDRFAPVMAEAHAPKVKDPRLLLASDDGLDVYYLPFEHVCRSARIALVGITPGPTQIVNGLGIANRQLRAGKLPAEVMEAAKRAAAFSGEPMRGNLIKQLDHWGVHRWLGIQGAADLFSGAAHLVHNTSLLRHPVFKDGEPYNGAPNMLRSPLLREQLLEHFANEIDQLPDAVFVGLGPVVWKVLNWLVAEKRLDRDRVVSGVLHPSGNNTYRIAYLIGDRSENIPHATNPAPYDAGRRAFQARVVKTM